MFSRSLLKQSRSAASAAIKPSTSASLASRAPSPFIVRSTAPRAFTSRLTSSRYYSSEAEKKTETAEGAAEATEGDAVQKELEAKNKEIVDLKDRYLRSVADFRNLQERTKRDIDSARTFAIQRFATDLTESIDNFDRALSTVPAEKLSAQKDLNELYTGLKMTETILMNTLKKHGLERFDPSVPDAEGNAIKFDPKVHEATFMTKMEGKEDGTVFMTQSKGFTLNGRTLRAAKVGVVKNT